MSNCNGTKTTRSVKRAIIRRRVTLPGVLRFADLYELNKGYNPRAYHNAGHPFIILKASEGPGHIDSEHRIRTLQAHQVGLPVGHYHFCRPEAGSVLGEATMIRDALTGLIRAGEPLILDIEVPDKNAAVYIRELERAIRRFTNIPRLEIIGYTFVAYLLEHPSMDVSSHKWWMADFGKRPPSHDGPRICWAWQYSETALIQGVFGTSDGSILTQKASIDYWRKQIANRGIV